MINSDYKIIRIGFTFALLLLITVIFFLSFPFTSSPESKDRKTTYITDFTAALDGHEENVTLPYNFKKLKDREPVILTARVSSSDNDCLYVKSVYAPFRLFLDSKLIYRSGEKGSYPAFMSDPPTDVAVVQLGKYENAELKLEYLSPVSQSHMTIYPLILGTEADIINTLFKKMGFSFVFSVFLLLFGTLLFIVSIFIVSIGIKNTSFFWLGLFSVAVGLWIFCECNFTGILTDHTALLYSISFIALLILPVPLIRFGLAAIDFHSDRMLNIFLYIYLSILIATLWLQLSGVVQLSQSACFFRIIIPILICVFTGNILYEIIRYKTLSAKRFFPSFMALSLFSVLELINYTLHFISTISLVFQIGLIIFSLCNGFVCGFIIKDALEIREKTRQLEFKLKLADTQSDAQTKQYRLLYNHINSVRTQSHDMRHQLIVMKSYAQNNDIKGILEYIDTLITAIPTYRETSYFQNPAVDAILQYYSQKAQSAGISVTIKLDVPPDLKNIPCSRLCVILANLFDNAVEACERMTDGEKFIHIAGRMEFETLVIVMDNSFNGIIKKHGDKFVSCKTNDIGIGLNSIIQIAEEYNGGARFEADGNVFKSSVYLIAPSNKT